MEPGPQYLFGSVSRTGAALRIDADRKRRRAGLALRQRRYDTTNERDGALRRRERLVDTGGLQVLGVVVKRNAEARRHLDAFELSADDLAERDRLRTVMLQD